MQTLPDVFVRQFLYNWKELRKSDPRLAREFGLTIDEVRRVKGLLVNDPGARSFVEDDEQRPAPIRRVPERETRPVYVPPAEPGPQHKGIVSLVYSELAQGTMNAGRQLLSRLSGVIFEEDARARQEGLRKQQIRMRADERSCAPVTAAKGPVPARAWQDTLCDSEAVTERGRPAPATAPVARDEWDSGKSGDGPLQKIKETVEKAEFDQELERRFSVVKEKLLSEPVAEAAAREPAKYKYEPEDDQPVVFNTTLEQVLYRQALKKILNDRKEIRCKGIIEIEQIGQNNRAALRALFPIVQDSDPDVRAQVLISFITLGVLESVPLFKEALNDENARVRMAAIRGLFKFSGRASGQFLYHALNDESTVVRETVAQHVVTSGDTAAVSELIEHLGRESDPTVRIALLQTLTLVRDKSTVACFISMLNDPTPAVRRLAVLTLEEWTGKLFGYLPDETRLKREPAIQEYINWWSKAKDTFQFMAKELKRKKAATPMSAPVVVQERRKNVAVPVTLPPEKKEALKEIVTLLDDINATPVLDPKATAPGRKTRTSRFDFNALEMGTT